MRQFIRKAYPQGCGTSLCLCLCFGSSGSPLSSSKVQKLLRGHSNLSRVVKLFPGWGSESVWRSAHTQSIQDAFTRKRLHADFDNARQKQANQIKAIQLYFPAGGLLIRTFSIEESGSGHCTSRRRRMPGFR